MKRQAMALVVAGIVGAGVLAACSTDASYPHPGATVTGYKGNPDPDGELPAVYLGKVDGEEVYTLCYKGDRLFFWATFREGAMAIHPNDPTCSK